MPLPTGPAVAFLFTDIEGSTRLERAVGSAAWADVVGHHDQLLRAAIEGNRGVVVKTEGDAFFAAFAAPIDAVVAAAAAQRSLAAASWPDPVALRVRMGIHLGEGRLRVAHGAGEPGDYVGIDVNYAARITASGNGGQVVLSAALVAALPETLAGVSGLGDAHLADDGPRAVKDFEEPRRLFRLVIPGVADDVRPLRTMEAPGNLPGEVTSLVGRETMVAALTVDLAAHRIVTLTGPGGSGKTRLAMAVAAGVRGQFPHGTWFVDLASVRQPGMLIPAIAATLDVRESTERTADEALRAHLRDRTILLVLDNLEQLLPEGARVVAGLLRDAPRLSVLATSRELLRVSGERGCPVPPLDAEAGSALFVDRALAHRPELAPTAETLAVIRAISERLGGLPLAIELAAARIRLLNPPAILDRLVRSLDLAGGARDLPERQRTLRGTMAWSFDLLAPEEQRLFTRLGVFASSWTAESALAVADPDGELGIDLVDGLESLADKSLVRVEPPDQAGGESWFGLHPLLREYALERLTAGGERAAVEARFAATCLDIAERAGRGILGVTGEASMTRLDHEDRNLRAAIDWGLANDRAELGVRIMAATWRWFQQRGRLREARAVLADLLARTPGSDPRLRIAGLAAEGGLAYWMNDAAAAGQAYEERLALAVQTGDPVLEADAHYDIGFLSMMAQDRERLRSHEEIALRLYTEAGQHDGAIRARQALVLGVFLGGDNDRAIALEEQNLAAFRAARSQVQTADSLTLLSAIRWRSGDLAGAWRCAIDALRLWSTIDSAAGMARVLGIASIIQLADGDPEAGARIAGAVYRLVREKGVMLAPVNVLHLPDPAGLVAERVPAEMGAALLAEGDALPLAEMAQLVLSLPGPIG